MLYQVSGRVRIEYAYETECGCCGHITDGQGEVSKYISIRVGADDEDAAIEQAREKAVRSWEDDKNKNRYGIDDYWVESIFWITCRVTFIGEDMLMRERGEPMLPGLIATR